MTTQKKRRLVSGMLAGSMALAAALFVVHSCWWPGSDAVVCNNGRVCPPGQTCTVDEDACIPKSGGCGDGIVDLAAGEVCDDGNQHGDDQCSAKCNSDLSCGNGITDPGEECDDGNRSNNDSCRDGDTEKCKKATCGDGFVYVGVEECDDGNLDNTDACLCLPSPVPGESTLVGRLARCGDGYQQTGVEECDDGNQKDTDACVSGCKSARCGDGFLWTEDVGDAGAEGCDDGNKNNNDGCPDDTASAVMRETCKPARCGDGYVHEGVEECDDRNMVDGDGCSHDCKVCGNGRVDSGEECDDGNRNDHDGCPSGPLGRCQNARCGDSIIWNEACEPDDCEACDPDGCKNCGCSSGPCNMCKCF